MIAKNPIFVVAVTGRSGSTLIQRLISSSASICMWGEVNLLIREIYKHVDQYKKISKSHNVINSREQYEQLGNNGWIPNLHPQYRNNVTTDLFDSHFAISGFDRWGCKIITWYPEMVNRVFNTFPNAQFIFIHRNLHDAQKSALATSWWRSMPKGRWTDKYNKFMKYFEHLPNGMNSIIIDYDEVITDISTLPVMLEKFLNVSDIDADIINHRVGNIAR